MNLNKNVIIVALFLLFGLIGISTISIAMSDYNIVDVDIGIVTGTEINVRTGPGINFNIITTITKNENVKIFGKIGDWYIIQTDKDYIGVANSTYIDLVYPNNIQGNSETILQPILNTGATGIELTVAEKEMFDLINDKRVLNGLNPLKIDKELQNIARLKAKDMVDENYFSHQSEIFGSLFDMMRDFGINYKTASENIAGNSSSNTAVEAWMNSLSHRANILDSKFHYTGIGIAKSPIYGKIYVQMFIGR